MSENPYESPEMVPESKRWTIPRAVWIRVIEYPIVAIVIAVLLWALQPATSSRRPTNSAAVPSQPSGR